MGRSVISLNASFITVDWLIRIQSHYCNLVIISEQKKKSMNALLNANTSKQLVVRGGAVVNAYGRFIIARESGKQNVDNMW